MQILARRVTECAPRAGRSGPSWALQWVVWWVCRCWWLLLRWCVLRYIAYMRPAQVHGQRDCRARGGYLLIGTRTVIKQHHQSQAYSPRSCTRIYGPESLLLETRSYSDCPDVHPFQNTSDTSVLYRPIYLASGFLRTIKITGVKKSILRQLIY